jgi:hypothetical protein
VIAAFVFVSRVFVFDFGKTCGNKNDKFCFRPFSTLPTATFNFLYGMIWKWMNWVLDRPMSRAGKETFLKAMIQSIPNHVMSCFQILITNCDKMRSAIANQ